MKHILLITIASVLLVGCVPRNTDAGKALFNNVEIEKLEEIIYVLFGLIICSGPIIAFFVASKGFSILYLFLLADLLCCAFVVAVFYSFYNKLLNEKIAYFSIIMGLILGLLFFPAPDFSKSLLVGIIVPMEIFPAFISQSLLFLSFLIATLVPAIVIMTNDSIKRR